METEQRIDEQTRRRARSKGKSAIRNSKEEVGSVQEEWIAVQRRGTAIRNCKAEVVEAQQGGIDGERRECKSAIGNRKEAKMTDAEVELEVERLWIRFAIATGKKALIEMETEEERRAWLCRPPEYRRGKEKVGEAEPSCLENDESDPMALEAEVFRRHWKAVWTGIFGSYEDITRIPPMLYTDKKREPNFLPLVPMETLQIFSVKIAETAQGLPWPLDVFGMVVARDVLDHNRNIIFHRTRDNCQTISTENPYLELIGPSRAVVVIDPVHLEVMLQVKGSVQSKDKDLSFLAVQYDGALSGLSESRVLKRVCPSKLSTVELTFASIVRSVEATISVQVVGGIWPDGFRGEFTANTTSLDDMKIQLLTFGDGKLPVTADGMVKLSRRVVSVELKGELRVSVKAVGDQAVERSDSKVFRARRSSRCKADVEVGSCKMKVTVAWSLVPDDQYPSP